jgi:hypothetical protein
MPKLPFKIPRVWAEGNDLPTPPAALGQNVSSVMVELKLGTIPVSQRQ